MGGSDLKDMLALGGSAGAMFYFAKFLLEWLAGRYDKRQAQLDAEHNTLDLSWKEYRVQLEKRMKTVERQNRALRLSFEHVAGALIRHDPENPALAIADRIMATAFPDDFSLSVSRLDQAGDSVGL